MPEADALQTLRDRFRALIHTDAFKLPNKSDNWTFTLEESAPNGSYSIKIENVPQDAFLLQIDGRFSVPGRVIKNAGCTGFHKLCDYILVSEAERLVIMIELKSGASNRGDDVTKQLRGGLAVFRFCKTLLEQEDLHFLNDFSHHFIALDPKEEDSPSVGDPCETQTDIPPSSPRHFGIAYGERHLLKRLLHAKRYVPRSRGTRAFTRQG